MVIFVLVVASGATILDAFILFQFGLRQAHRSAGSGCTSADQLTSASVSTRYGSAVSNLWNLQSADGSIVLCYTSETGMNSSVSFSNVKVQGPPQNFVGYPEVGYGNNVEGDSFGPQSTMVSFPMTILSLSQLNPWSNTTFVVKSLTAGSIDIGYDLWIKGSVGGPSVSADYEVMILFYVPGPCTSYSAATYQFTDTVYIDSAPKLETWTVCVAAAGTHARLAGFTLTGPSEIDAGSVALRPMDFIQSVEARVNNRSLSNYYVEGFEFGTEFWSSSANQAVFQWSLSHWSIGSEGHVVSVVG